MDNGRTLNLRKNAVETFWKSRSISISKLLSPIEDIESWCVDDEVDVKESLTTLAQILSDRTDIYSDQLLDQADRVFFILAYMHFSRAMRMLIWFDETYKDDDFSQKLVNLAIQNKKIPYCRLFLDRLFFVKEFAQLNTIYSKDRSKQIQRILEKIKGDKDG